jgi:lysozyme
MNVNKQAIDLIKEFEGFRAETYLDPVVFWTIGYGTTANAGVGITPKAGMKITEAEATEYLWRAVDKFAANVEEALTRNATENEFGAMVSLAYNIGPGAFKRSTVLREFNAGNKQAAADAFRMWNKAGGAVLRGLTRRREAERNLFLTPPQKPASAPVAPAAPADTPTPATGLWARLLAALVAMFTKGRA